MASSLLRNHFIGIQIGISVAICTTPALLKAQLNVGNLITKNKYIELPLLNVEKEISLTATIKGNDHTFLLDTGAPFFISDSLQRLYKFPVVYQAKLSDASGKEGETIIVKVDTLKVGPFVYTDLLALVLNMSNSTHHCDVFMGNFGSNLLRFLVVQFDAKKNKLILTDNDKLLKRKIPVPFSPAVLNEQSDFIFPVTINNYIVDSMHFDSGDGKLYEITEKPLQQLIGKFPNQVVRKGNGVTSVGSLGIPNNSPQIKLVSQISFNKAVINNAVVNSTTASRSRMGRYLFNYGILTLDYINKQYAFEKYKKPKLPPQYDFGFSIITNGKKVIAGTVWNGSEAEKKGMKSGCEIVSIDGVKFSDLPLCDIEPEAKKHRTYSMIEVVFVDEKENENKIKLTKQYLLKK
jgi:Aspartyl protease